MSLALLALFIEAFVGYPRFIFARIGHPVTWIGALIGALDARINRDGDTFAQRRRAGVITLALLVALAFSTGWTIERIIEALPFGWLIAAFFASTLLAQRSLHEHVSDVAAALGVSIAASRAAVGKIVGRDVAELDEAGVARAAIESLAENFADGVVAPTLYLALFGLPGVLVYKAVNTADSMIGHKSARYLAFGWASARADDVLNFIPARVAAMLIAFAAALASASPHGAFTIARRDARNHASPNAGWPEAAMAGALGLKLGGPRAYHGATLDAPIIGDGCRAATREHLGRALALYRFAAIALWLVIGVGATITG